MFSFVSPLTNVLTDFSGLHCAEENGVLYLYFAFKPSLGSNSSEDVDHQQRVKGGNDLACHRLYLASYYFLMSLKHRDTKRRILKVLKIAHEKFTWSGKEIPHVGRYGGHKW